MYLTVKFYNLSIVPDGSVYMGDGDFDFQADRMPVNVKEKLAFYRDWETDRKSTRLNSSHSGESRMPSSA